MDVRCLDHRVENSVAESTHSGRNGKMIDCADRLNRTDSGAGYIFWTSIGGYRFFLASLISKINSMAPYRYLEEYNIKVTRELHSRYSRIIDEIGEDVNREGLLKTPERAAKAMLFLTQGYKQDAVEILKSAMFRESYSEMVIIKDIEVYSLCEHHMLPFFGKAHVAYIPDGHIVGLSKIPRVVDVFARRLQVQERLTDDILECINNTLQPKGVAVVIEAAHMCMMMRGVQKQNSVTTTSGFRGQFEKIETRNEFLKLISSDLS